MRWCIAAIVIASAVVGCDKADDDGLQACDPFVSMAEPIELNTIRAIGRDVLGTIYLADYVPGTWDDHVFVSIGNELHRRRVLGGGGGSDGTTEVTMYIVEGNPDFNLQIEVTDGATRMGVLFGEDVDTFEIGEQGEELEVVGADAIAGMTLVNLPIHVDVEYLAQTEDGRVLVILRPTDDWDYEDFRLFLGEADALDERAIDSVVREKDGGTTTIEFELDGAIATAYFPVMYGPAGFEHGPWTLTLADQTTDLTELAAIPQPAGFRCLAPAG